MRIHVHTDPKWTAKELAENTAQQLQEQYTAAGEPLSEAMMAFLRTPMTVGTFRIYGNLQPPDSPLSQDSKD